MKRDAQSQVTTDRGRREERVTPQEPPKPRVLTRGRAKPPFPRTLAVSEPVGRGGQPCLSLRVHQNRDPFLPGACAAEPKTPLDNRPAPRNPETPHSNIVPRFPEPLVLAKCIERAHEYSVISRKRASAWRKSTSISYTKLNPLQVNHMRSQRNNKT